MRKKCPFLQGGECVIASLMRMCRDGGGRCVVSPICTETLYDRYNDREVYMWTICNFYRRVSYCPDCKHYNKKTRTCSIHGRVDKTVRFCRDYDGPRPPPGLLDRISRWRMVSRYRHLDGDRDSGVRAGTYPSRRRDRHRARGGWWRRVP